MKTKLLDQTINRIDINELSVQQNIPITDNTPSTTSKLTVTVMSLSPGMKRVITAMNPVKVLPYAVLSMKTRVCTLN